MRSILPEYSTYDQIKLAIPRFWRSKVLGMP